ncbi:MAG: glycosyltransferase family 2 protein [Planctomycetota bacterium]|jgi:glycosyltransferase involved in cell wall biosynthesis|nr:glycosyltransferase family 2 protein [Planctomycetota bacterium]
MPLISVIIPCRNGANYLAEAVASVQAQLGAFSAEIIIVNDGSTDNTAALARSLDCQVISLPPSGVSAARNAALKIMRGDFVMFLDHDDVLETGALTRLLAEFTADLDIVSAKMQDFISPELPAPDCAKLAPRPEPYGGLLPGAYLFRREALTKIGGFDEKLQTGQGVDFLMRCVARELKEKKLDFISARRRLHNDNMGRTLQQQENKDYATILRRKIGLAQKLRGGGSK